MHVTMVKKQLASGLPCRKCIQAEDLLRSRGLWDRIDRIVVAVEGDPESEGMRLGQRFGIDTAPFFVLRNGDGDDEAFASTLKLVQVLDPPRAVAAKPRVTPEELSELISSLSTAEPQDIIRTALDRLGAECAIAWSGAEDVVLIDMAVRSGLQFSVFSVDTGRLHPETYRFIDKVRARPDLFPADWPYHIQ